MDIQDGNNEQSAMTDSQQSKNRRGRQTAVATLLLVAMTLLFSLSSSSALMGGEGLMWTVWQSEPVRLVVCWENPDDADPLPGEIDQTPGWQRRERVRLALKNSWEREARIIFVGWQQCQDEGNPATPPHTLGPRRPGTADENLKVQITSSGGGQNPGHGSWGDYQQPGIIINLHCGNQTCMKYLAIHEFGHALGFYHGEERSDWPTDIPNCPPQNHPPTPPWWPIPTELRWGAPDRDSVMAYCSGGPDALSPGDVAAVQRAYERHLPGTLLSLPGSLCLSAHADAPDGDNAFGWVCDEANDDQEWQYDVINQALYIQWPTDPLQTQRCLEVDTLNYSTVQIWDCHYGANQQWQFEQITIRGYGGLCLTRAAGGAGALTMQVCADAARQLWRVEQSELAGLVRLRSNSGNLCLTLAGGSSSDALAEPCATDFLYLPLVMNGTIGGQVANSSGAGGWVQNFLLGSEGKIAVFSLTSPSLCLDVRDVWDSDYINGQGGPAEGQTVQFFDCYVTQLNQKWGFSGHLTSEDKCLALSGNAVDNGVNAIVTACSNAPQQKWDYHW